MDMDLKMINLEVYPIEREGLAETQDAFSQKCVHPYVRPILKKDGQNTVAEDQLDESVVPLRSICIIVSLYGSKFFWTVLINIHARYVLETEQYQSRIRRLLTLYVYCRHEVEVSQSKAKEA